jgi:hypothetical protein
MADEAVGSPFLHELTDELIAGAFIPASLVAKHRAYKHEHEMRLMMIVGPNAQLKNCINRRTREGEIVPFIPRSMPIRPDGICKIVAGPGANDVNISELKSFLRSHSLNADRLVTRSTIPYRPSR